MKSYLLTDKDIEQILKEGKFDKNKYAGNLAILAWISKDVYEDYCNEEENYFTRYWTENKDKIHELYEEISYLNISDNLAETVSEYLSEELYDQINFEKEEE